LVVAAAIDLRSRRIPDACIVSAVAIRLAYLVHVAATGGDAGALVTRSLAGAVGVTIPLVALVLVMDRVLGRPSMGGGDVKLLGVCGLYLGVVQVMLLVAVACAVGLAGNALSRRPRGATRPRDFPFAPAIATGCMVAIAWGPTFEGWLLAA
jgi:leader peptidase (prepilin peptidase)/N-methyltransferase